MNDHAIAWALHALEPDEELAMRTHLPGCRRCRDTVRETELVMGGLATSVEQTDPPARLRGSILARAAETQQARPGRRLTAAGTPHRRATREAGFDRDTAGGSARPDRRWGLGGRRRLVAAALAAVAVFGVGGLGVYTAQVQQQRDTQIARAQSLADLVTQLDRPGTSHATLSTGVGEPVAAVLVTASERTVVTAGLPANDRDDATYVVWGLGAGDPRPLGTFDVATTGPDVHNVDAEADGSQFTSYAVSLEPGRDMPASPTTVVASGAVQA